MAGGVGSFQFRNKLFQTATRASRRTKFCIVELLVTFVADRKTINIVHSCKRFYLNYVG